jgi:hypothetical protein
MGLRPSRLDDRKRPAIAAILIEINGARAGSGYS